MWTPEEEQQLESQQQSEKQQPSKKPIIIQLAEVGESASIFSAADSEDVTVAITLNMHECTRENVKAYVDKVFDQMIVNCQGL